MAANNLLNGVEQETGDQLPPEIRETFMAKFEEGVALAMEMAFTEGRIIGELLVTDPRGALEALGGEEGAREKLEPQYFEQLMIDVRKQNGESE